MYSIIYTIFYILLQIESAKNPRKGKNKKNKNQSWSNNVGK